jgi:ribonuclease HI
MSKDQNELPEVTIYTDGGSLGNPGPGGYGVVLLYGKHRKELSGGFRLTTNNRMEITAAIVGLEALKTPCKVTLYSDSRYLVDAINKGWAKRWQKNNWRRNKSDRALNPDLWQKLLKLIDRHQVTFRWTKGHAGNPENERCDQLAVQAASQEDLPPDRGYSPQLSRS